MRFDFRAFVVAALATVGSVHAQSVEIQPTTIIGAPSAQVDVEVRVSAPVPCTFLQFTLDYQSDAAAFVSATIGSDLQSRGFYISNLITDPAFPPTTPQTDKNLVVQIFGGGANTFDGSGLLAAVLTFSIDPSCEVTPLAFEEECHPNTHLVTETLETLCYPTLQLDSGVLASNCATDTRETPGPGGARLFQNVPNPFNPSTRIRFSLARAGRARLEILDALGRSIRVLLDSEVGSGSHEVQWDGRADDGSQVASGLYYYRLLTPTGSDSRRMILIK